MLKLVSFLSSHQAIILNDSSLPPNSYQSKVFCSSSRWIRNFRKHGCAQVSSAELCFRLCRRHRMDTKQWPPPLPQHWNRREVQRSVERWLVYNERRSKWCSQHVPMSNDASIVSRFVNSYASIHSITWSQDRRNSNEHISRQGDCDRAQRLCTATHQRREADLETRQCQRSDRAVVHCPGPSASQLQVVQRVWRPTPAPVTKRSNLRHQWRLTEDIQSEAWGQRKVLVLGEQQRRRGDHPNHADCHRAALRSSAAASSNHRRR